MPRPIHFEINREESPRAIPCCAQRSVLELLRWGSEPCGLVKTGAAAAHGKALQGHRFAMSPVDETARAGRYT